jgi:citronellol/citronellal dehydrogenase
MTNNSLAGKVVLITGASRGIGAACALALAQAGAQVAVAAKTVQPHPKLRGTLGEVAEKVRAVGQSALPLQVDVRDAAAVEKTVLDTVDHFGRLDAVVNNAGAIHLANVADWSVKRFDLVMSVNVRAAFVATQAALPHLRKQGGHVLMMSPPIHPEASPGKAPYLVSKIGMTMLAMAVDAEEENVSACSLWPVTAIRTAATENSRMGSERDWRSPRIVADATVSLLSRDPLQCRFRAWLDEEVLKEQGIQDFSAYRCDPEHEPGPMSAKMVDPNFS